MTSDELHIWDILKLHTGIKDAIQVRRLSVITGIPDRHVRMIVKRLIEIHHKPIGSTVHAPYGYYVIVNNEERKQVRRSLIRRMLSLLGRVKAYEPQQSLWVRQMQGELELELGEKR